MDEQPQKPNNHKEVYPCNTRGCTNDVVFSDKDREFYIQKGFTNPDGTPTKPKYCPSCRAERKAARG